MKVPLHERIPVDRWPYWVRRVAAVGFLGGPLLLSWFLGIKEEHSASLHLITLLAGWMPTVLIMGLYGHPPHATRTRSDWGRAWLRALWGVSLLAGAILVTVLSAEAGELALPHMNRDN